MTINASQGSQDGPRVDAVPAPSPTPGPWVACDPGDYADFNGASRVILGDDVRVAVVHWNHADGGETDANATLIAASLDMAEALRPIAWLAAQHPDAGTFDTQMISTKLLRDAAAAYLKATGGQP